MAKINSCSKGKRGERAFRDVLREAGYCKARRGRQFSGSPESPDVICPELPDIHWEVKNCERGNPYDWIAQAEEDSPGDYDSYPFPVVAHKRNGMQWLAILPMTDFLEIVRRSDLPQ
jgi:hypothetical protein